MLLLLTKIQIIKCHLLFQGMTGDYITSTLRMTLYGATSLDSRDGIRKPSYDHFNDSGALQLEQSLYFKVTLRS